MAIQSSNSSPARNTSRAVGAGGSTKQTKIPLPASHSSTVTSDGQHQSAQAPGASVKGFSGSGTLKGYVK